MCVFPVRSCICNRCNNLWFIYLMLSTQWVRTFVYFFNDRYRLITLYHLLHYPGNLSTDQHQRSEMLSHFGSVSVRWLIFDLTHFLELFTNEHRFMVVKLKSLMHTWLHCSVIQNECRISQTRQIQEMMLV